jgi:outer membrane protein assembly factor BamA
MKDVLSLTRLEARQADGLLTANGDLNVTSKEVHAEANVSDLKIDQIADLSTAASLKAQVSGTYESPIVDIKGVLRDVVYRQEAHGTVRLEGTTNLKTARVRANADKYDADLSGEITLGTPYAFDATLTAKKSQIRYQNYEAVADGRARIIGQAEPFKMENVELDRFTLNGEGIELAIHGTMQSGVQVDGKVDLAELPVDGVELEGTAQTHATVSGSFNDPSINGEVTTTGAKVRTAQIPEAAEISANIGFTGRDISIRDLRAEMAGATATITGRGSWKGDGQLQFRIANVRPENFVKDQPVSGVASLEGEVDLRSPRPEDISGRVKVTELKMTVRGTEIHQTDPIEVELGNQVLTVKHFQIEGFDTHATITGHANLGDRTVNFDADADTDLVILEPFIPKSHPAGRIKTRVSLRGTTDHPSFDGFVSVAGGELAIEQPDVLLSGLDIEAQLRGDRIELSRANGLVNGGMFEASGGTGLSAKGLQDAALVMNVERGQLEFPEGLQSEFSAKLKVEGSSPTLTLNGNIDVQNAIYEKDFNLTQAVFANISSPQGTLNTAAAPGSTGDQIRLEVDVQTKNPILIKNNVADLEANGTFRIRGTAANPIILGRALVMEGGELYFGPAINTQSVETTRRSDRYAIERGSIDFNNALRTEPDLDFLATHDLEVKDERYLVTLKVTGTPSTLKAELTSDPHEEQSDIIAMLLTGRTVHELQGTYADVAGEQALGYVSGRLSERLLTQAGGVLGLNTVRIDPVTVANQTDLAARLTIAKDVTTDFSLIYSQYLNNAKAQTWIASYHPYKNLVLRGVNDAEQNEVVVDLKHDLRFGGAVALDHPRPENEARLRSVTFTGTQFANKELEKKVTREGEPFGSYRMTQDVRSLRRFLASQGYPRARVETQQSVINRSVDVRFDITEGPRIELVYEGADVPKELRAEIEQIWTMRPSDAAALRDSTSRLLRHFRSEGYLQARISAEPPASPSGQRRYVFKIEPGEKFKKPEWVFHGVEPIDIQKPAGLVMENPEEIKELIESHLRSNGYLDVKSTVPTLVIQGTEAHFEVTVDGGKPYTVAGVQFEGNHAFDAEHLRGVVTSEKSKEKEQTAVRFTPAWLETARQRITSEYWKSGYNDVLIVPSTKEDSKLAQVSAQFAIVEGEAQRIAAIEITGDDLTSRTYINRQFQFKPGDPLDYTKINLTRKKLYDTRAFRRVDIEVAPGENGHIARVRLSENAPWQLRYGVAVTEHLENGERQVGFGVDLSYNNLFGRGIVTGFSGKVNEDERDGRVFASAPQFFGRSATTSMTFFRTRDLTDPEDIVDYWGTTVQQQWRFRERYIFGYDYSYRKVLRGAREPGRADEDSILDDIRVPLARFGTTISRDTRDDLLNATRGTFTSNSFEIAPPGIGSSVLFLRNYSQYFRFRSVKKFVLAGGIRFGFARPFKGQEMDPTLQFESGGGTTVRAFKQDELTREPGNYVLILNQEFRFPLFWKFSGVTFFDAGQVTNRTDALFKFRYGPGLGIRIQTPFVLLRTDLGINVSSRPGEAKARWAFGIGQAF